MTNMTMKPGEGLESVAVEAAAFPMVGENIVCFAKDWGEDPTSCNHVLNGLSHHNKVLWLNSISTRTPNLGSGRDLKKIFAKLSASMAGPRQVGENLWVCTPVVLPLHHNKAAVRINTVLMRATIRRLCRSLGMGEFQLWTFVPTSAPYISRMGAKKTVYYCTDNWSSFSSMDGARIGRMMQDQAREADVVFGTSQALVDKLGEFNPNTRLAAHGVNYPQFARALDSDLATPEDIADMTGPVLGFYGLVEDWMDQDLLCGIAQRHPDWNIVLVGKACVDTSRLASHPNIRLVGRKPHDQLPAYCKRFTVAMIPHLVNDLTRFMNPIKLREYLSAGLPVVSTDLPEVRFYGEHCAVTRSHEEFGAACAAAILADSPEARRLRSETMKSETWDARIRQIAGLVQQTPARRR